MREEEHSLEDFFKQYERYDRGENGRSHICRKWVGGSYKEVRECQEIVGWKWERQKKVKERCVDLTQW